MSKKWLVWAALLCVLLLIAVLIVTQLATREEGEQPRDDRLLIPEGWRASQIYDATDKALGLERGATQKAARETDLNLPKAAEGDPEGYLFPATYPITDEASAPTLLSFMVNTANSTFSADGLPAAADSAGMTVYETVAIASIVQAEADTPQDMGKVARVIHNRLDQDMTLQMDSTINYALNRSTLDTSHADTRTNSPYNTYQHRGLPPTPISNPGQEALKATAKPATGDWLYFVTVRPGDTRFSSDYAEHQRHVEEFNEEQSRSPSESATD